MGHGHGAKKKKEKAKFPLLGIVAWWVAYSTFAFHPILGIVTVVTLSLIPGMAEAIVYPFQKILEIADEKKKEKEKEKKAHSHTDHH